MAQRKPSDQPPEIDQAWLEQLRNDPRIVHHRQSSTEPFVSELEVTPGLDVLELLGRRGDDDEDDE
jgi:hypothetical protein